LRILFVFISKSDAVTFGISPFWCRTDHPSAGCLASPATLLMAVPSKGAFVDFVSLEARNRF